MERKLLQKLNIPNVDMMHAVNLQFLICYPVVIFYLEESFHHCTVQECYTVCWSTTNVVQNKYFFLFV